MPFYDTTLRNARDAALAAYADELAAEIAKTAAIHDTNGSFPHDHFALLRERDALALTIPEELGGQGRSLYELLLFQERLARGSGSTALTLGWHLMAFGYLNFDLKWSRARYEQLCADVVERGHLINVLVTEREVGNLLRGAKASTQAVRTANGYRITGRKAFCSGAPALAQMVVYAWVESDQRMAEFLVPAGEGVQVIENWNTLGMRSTASHDVVFDNVLVPHDALLSYIDKGKASSFTTGSKVFGLQLAAVYLGIASAARDFAIEFAAGYQSSSLGSSILDAPQVQLKLGEIELLLGGARNLLYGLADRWERHHAIRHRLERDVAITKHTVTNNAIRAVDLAMGIVGGHSLSRELPLERYFRDVRCGLHNPPQDDMVINQLAQEAVRRQRAANQPSDAPASNVAPHPSEPALAAA